MIQAVYDRDRDALEIAAICAIRFARRYLEAFEKHQITNSGSLDSTGYLADLARISLDEIDSAKLAVADGRISIDAQAGKFNEH